MLCLHGWKREGVPVYEYSTMKVLTCQHTVWWLMLGHMLTAIQTNVQLLCDMHVQIRSSGICDICFNIHADAQFRITH